mmetsp:Transcript_29197/g.94188  ORF Transcript_29197/g.94188 Transcript_29197/m.94188 type:complete len:208 (+) Transcript_29197:798-1421(+)
MARFSTAVRDAPPAAALPEDDDPFPRTTPPWTTSISRRRQFRYTSLCVSDMGVKRIVSDFGGSDFSTSCLRRRSTKGLSNLWSCSMMAFFASASTICKLKSSSNFSDDAKTSGKRKFSKAQSSCKLFCRGVPVISKRFSTWSWRTVLLSWAFSFLMRWASSTISMRHPSFVRVAFSRLATSYVVTTTSHVRPSCCVIVAALLFFFLG